MPKPTTFRDLRGEGDSYGERNDCSVIALAVAAGIPYAQAHETLRKLGRRKGARTPSAMTFKALAVLQRRFRVLKGWDLSYGRPQRHITPHPGHPLLKAKTMVSAERVLRRHYPGRRFLLWVRGHIAAFDGEQVQDWSSGRRHKIIGITEVLP